MFFLNKYNPIKKSLSGIPISDFPDKIFWLSIFSSKLPILFNKWNISVDFLSTLTILIFSWINFFLFSAVLSSSSAIIFFCLELLFSWDESSYLSIEYYSKLFFSIISKILSGLKSLQ